MKFRDMLFLASLIQWAVFESKGLHGLAIVTVLPAFACLLSAWAEPVAKR